MFTGKYPYTIEEIKQVKIRQVKYDIKNTSLSNQAAQEEAKSFGMDPISRKLSEGSCSIWRESCRSS